MKFSRTVFLFLITISVTVFPQEMKQTYISLNNTGVAEFAKEHPGYDGRGTIILILDTGVDMGIDGLTQTSTGEVKVIDAQDFTHQGDINFYPAEIDEVEIDGKDVKVFISKEKDFKIAGADGLSLSAADDKYFIGVIEEKLWKNSGSGVKDINGNGAEDDKFFFVTFKTLVEGTETNVVFIDLNNNGTIADEKLVRNYKENFDSFIFERKDKVPAFTLALNIFPEENKIVLYFDDGGHGTNCAGIAAGFNIGEGGFNGIAPGAKVIGLKLGNNNYAGGATVAESMKKAYLYADKISKERKEPCIINMSFGIGSEIEGMAEIEQFLDSLLKDNKYLYVSTSNSNEGPGISSTGMPACSPYVFSSGAVLAKEVAADVYGTKIEKDYILHFSSRGGEVNKPDVVAPGASISTVPNFEAGDGSWGTSMASPYSAGVMAVLLGAAKTDFPDIKIPAQLLYKIIRESAVPIKGYNYADQGAGYINLKNAYELLKKYLKAGETGKFEKYTISSFAPNMPNYSSPNLYIRNGSFITGNEDFLFEISRDNYINQSKFYRILDVKSDSPWIKPVQSKIHFRNDQPAKLNVRIDKSIKQKPGLYNSKLTAFRTDGSNMPELEMTATVIIPYEFNSSNNYQNEWKEEILGPCEHKRYFVSVPAGATSMKIDLQNTKGKYANCWFFVHNPQGREEQYGYFDSAEDGKKSTRYIYNPEPGVYEVVVLGYFRAKDTSVYNLAVQFESIEILTKEPLSYLSGNKLEVVNRFNEAKTYRVSGMITGYEKEHLVKIDRKSSEDFNFTFFKGKAEKEFKISLSKEDFNKVTDFALMIYDEEGNALESDGLSYSKGSISIRNYFGKDTVNLKLTLIPGFANASDKVDVKIKEIVKIENPSKVNVSLAESSRLVLYPSVPAELNCSFNPPEKQNPDGYEYTGVIIFKNLDDETVMEMPVNFKF